MISLSKRFAKYTGVLRRLKMVYAINNLLNMNFLKHNIPLYQKFGIRKKIWQPIGSQDFSNSSGVDLPWLDQPNAAQAVQTHPAFLQFSPDLQAKILQFIEEGFIILEGFFEPEAVDQHNEIIAQLLKKSSSYSE